MSVFHIWPRLAARVWRRRVPAPQTFAPIAGENDDPYVGHRGSGPVDDEGNTATSVATGCDACVQSGVPAAGDQWRTVSVAVAVPVCELLSFADVARRGDGDGDPGCVTLVLTLSNGTTEGTLVLDRDGLTAEAPCVLLI